MKIVLHCSQPTLQSLTILIFQNLSLIWSSKINTTDNSFPRLLSVIFLGTKIWFAWTLNFWGQALLPDLRKPMYFFFILILIKFVTQIISQIHCHPCIRKCVVAIALQKDKNIYWTNSHRIVKSQLEPFLMFGTLN